MNGLSNAYTLYEYTKTYNAETGIYDYAYSLIGNIRGVLAQNQRTLQQDGASILTTYYTFVTNSNLFEHMKIVDESNDSYILTSVNNQHPRRKFAECKKVES